MSLSINLWVTKLIMPKPTITLDAAVSFEPTEGPWRCCCWADCCCLVPGCRGGACAVDGAGADSAEAEASAAAADCRAILNAFLLCSPIQPNPWA